MNQTGKKLNGNRRQHKTSRPPVTRYMVVSPFPSRRPITLKYAFTQNLVEGAAGTGTQQLWQLNGLFRPDGSAAGHQPLYYDQLFTATGPYLKFIITNCHVNIAVTNLSTTPVFLGFYVQTGAVDYPSRDALAEKPFVISKVIVGNSGGPCRASIIRKVDIAKRFGVPMRKLLDDDVYSGLWNSNPSQIMYGIFMTYGMPPAAAATSVTLETQLVFHGYAFGLSAIGSS